MDLVSKIVKAGIAKPPAPPRDDWSLGVAEGDSGAGVVSVTIDGDYSPTTLPTAVPVETGDRVLILLLGQLRFVVANLTSGSSAAGWSPTAGNMHTFIDGLSSLAGGSVVTTDEVMLSDVSASDVKRLTIAGLAAGLLSTLDDSLVTLESPSASWSPTWAGTGSLTVSNVSGADYCTLKLGKLGVCWWNADSLQIGGTVGYSSPTVTIPAGWTLSSDAVDSGVCGAFYANTGTAYQAGLVMLDYTNSRFMLAAPSNWSVGTGRQLIGAVAFLPLS